MKKLKSYAVFTRVEVKATSKKRAVAKAREIISEYTGIWAVTKDDVEAEILGNCKIIKE